MNYTALIGDPGGSGSHGLTWGHPVSEEGWDEDTPSPPSPIRLREPSPVVSCRKSAAVGSQVWEAVGYHRTRACPSFVLRAIYLLDLLVVTCHVNIFRLFYIRGG